MMIYQLRNFAALRGYTKNSLMLLIRYSTMGHISHANIFFRSYGGILVLGIKALTVVGLRRDRGSAMRGVVGWSRVCRV